MSAVGAPPSVSTAADATGIREAPDVASPLWRRPAEVRQSFALSLVDVAARAGSIRRQVTKVIKRGFGVLIRSGDTPPVSVSK
jgi:hypothetical protein